LQQQKANNNKHTGQRPQRHTPDTGMYILEVWSNLGGGKKS